LFLEVHKIRELSRVMAFVRLVYQQGAAGVEPGQGFAATNACLEHRSTREALRRKNR
jgi:hypothetical protein